MTLLQTYLPSVEQRPVCENFLINNGYKPLWGDQSNPVNMDFLVIDKSDKTYFYSSEIHGFFWGAEPNNEYLTSDIFDYIFKEERKEALKELSELSEELGFDD